MNRERREGIARLRMNIGIPASHSVLVRYAGDYRRCHPASADVSECQRHGVRSLVGMPMDTPMQWGMFLVLLGLILSLYGLYPRSAEVTAGLVSRIQVRTLDEAPIRAAHVGLLVVMAIAVTIDVMKPTALAFVAPGMALEYGLKSPLNPAGIVPVAYLPLSGIGGTVLGAFLWVGWAIALGDASILFGGITFIGTSICGCMPDYRWNFVMCFIMGLVLAACCQWPMR